MKLSELIIEAAKVIREHGDLIVMPGANVHNPKTYIVEGMAYPRDPVLEVEAALVGEIVVIR